VRILLLWCCLAAAAWGQVVGNDPTPLEPGVFRLQYSFYASNGKQRFDNQGRLTINLSQHQDLHQLRVAAGLAPNLDFFVQAGEGLVQSEHEDDGRLTHPIAAAGDDDVIFGLRWRIINEENLQLAWLVQPSFSSGPIEVEPGEQLGVGLGYNALTQILVLRQDFDRFSLWTEGFYSFPLGDKPGALRTWGSNLALGYLIGDSVQPTLELTYVSSQPGDIRYLGAALGVSWTISEQWSVSAALQQTLAGSNVDKVLRPMFIVNFTP